MWLEKSLRFHFLIVVFLNQACLLCQSADDDGGVNFPELKQQLIALAQRHSGDVAIGIEDFRSGRTIFLNENKVMPTASLAKIAAMIEAFRQSEAGELDFNAKITLRKTDKVPGAGILTGHFSPGLELSVRDALHLMMVYSDNTATNLLVDQIGLKSIAKTMDELGFSETKLNSKVYRGSTSTIDPKRSKLYGLGSTTAKEMLGILKQIQLKKMVSAAASKEMQSLMLQCDDGTKLARHFPTVTKFAHKTGAISHARCDAGILFTKNGDVGIVVLTANNKDRSWTAENSAEQLCGQIGKLVHTAYHRDTETSGQPKVLRLGSAGTIVEDLQRTLNARLSPSPNLSVDGDFGPATEAAVLKFQQESELKVNGIVDALFWPKLGDIVTANAAPKTDEKPAKKQEQDSLTGKPFVSAKAWAIAELGSGKVLFDSRKDQRLDIASTTKIMTAYLVLLLAETNPKVLDEVVTFSKNADATRGSTSGVRVGEQLSVKELLYGLLLPSGNDASVALAEHFGGRVSSKAKLPSKAKITNGSDKAEINAAGKYAEFIMAMNAAATELGMKSSSFKNPHGLTARGHQSTAANLIRLAVAAMKLNRFRSYVATRQHTTSVKSESGYTRKVTWKNTNQLLGIEGYIGIKTGTTSAAGACLVSAGKRNGKEIVLVILGSGSSRGRYADSRNLYRWAWSELNVTK